MFAAPGSISPESSSRNAKHSLRNGAASPKRAASKKLPIGASRSKDAAQPPNSPDQRHSPHRNVRESPFASSPTTPQRRQTMNRSSENSPPPRARKSTMLHDALARVYSADSCSSLFGRLLRKESGAEEFRKPTNHHRQGENLHPKSLKHHGSVDSSSPKSSQRDGYCARRDERSPRQSPSPCRRWFRDASIGIAASKRAATAEGNEHLCRDRDHAIVQRREERSSSAARRCCEPSSSSRSEAIETWWYKNEKNHYKHYEIRFEDDACCIFKEQSVGAEGTLFRVGDWYEGHVGVGIIRLRALAGGMLSQSKRTAESEWDPGIIASRSMEQADRVELDPLSLVSQFETGDMPYSSEGLVFPVGCTELDVSTQAWASCNGEPVPKRDLSPFVSRPSSTLLSAFSHEPASTCLARKLLVQQIGVRSSPCSPASLMRSGTTAVMDATSPSTPSSSPGLKPRASYSLSLGTVSPSGSACSVTSTRASSSDVPVLHKQDKVVAAKVSYDPQQAEAPGDSSRHASVRQCPHAPSARIVSSSVSVPPAFALPRRKCLPNTSTPPPLEGGYLLDTAAMHEPARLVEELQLPDESLDFTSPFLRQILVERLGLHGEASLRQVSKSHGGLNMGIYTAQDRSRTLILKLVTSTRFMGLPTEAELFLSLSQRIPSIAHDRELAFPLRIFLLRASNQATRNLIVMEKVPGQSLADIITRKLQTRFHQDLQGILQQFGTFLATFHKRYGMQHCDCQPGNVFYDESSGCFSLIDISEMGSPHIKELDVHHFCTGLQALLRSRGRHLSDEYSHAFKRSYSDVAAS